MADLSWLLPLFISVWMGIWIYWGYRTGGIFTMQLRAVGGVLLAASVWLIWWLMVGIQQSSIAQ